MKGLKQFFEAERKRVYQPGPFFTKRVMASLNQEVLKPAEESEIWEVIPSSTRPVFAVALMLMLCFLLAEVFIPRMPQSGLIESYLDAERNPTQSFLFTSDSDEVPSGQEIFEQVLGLGEERQ